MSTVRAQFQSLQGSQHSQLTLRVGLVGFHPDTALESSQLQRILGPFVQQPDELLVQLVDHPSFCQPIDAAECQVNGTHVDQR